MIIAKSTELEITRAAHKETVKSVEKIVQDLYDEFRGNIPTTRKLSVTVIHQELQMARALLIRVRGY